MRIQAGLGRRLAAIVAADVAGYSRLMGLDEVGTARTLREHHVVTDALLAPTPLRILRRAKRGDGAVCVMDPAGRRLKIPIWMLLPECAEITISQRPRLGKQALLSLASLIASQLDSPCPR